MYQLSALTPTEQSNLHHTATATALHLAVRPTRQVLQATVNLGMVNASLSPDFLPLTLPLISGSLAEARHGYTVELSDNNDNKEILPCWGIKTNSYLKIKWAMPPSMANGQAIMIFNSQYRPLLTATFKHYAEDVFAQVAEAALTNVSDSTKLAQVNTACTFNLVSDVNQVAYKAALSTVKTLADYVSPLILSLATTVHIFNDSVTSTTFYFTTDGSTPSGASSAISPGTKVSISGNGNINALKFIALRPLPILSLNITIGGRNPIASTNAEVGLGVEKELTDYFSTINVQSSGRATLINNSAAATEYTLYYTVDGTTPTTASAKIAPGKTKEITGYLNVEALKFIFLEVSPGLNLTNVYTYGAPTEPIIFTGMTDYQEGLLVGRNSLDFTRVALVKVFNERRVWQTFSEVILTLPKYPSTGELDARLRPAVFLSMVDETHCLIDATDTPELQNDSFTALFPEKITPPEEDSPIFIWQTNDPLIVPAPWLVVALRNEGRIDDDRGYYIPEGDEWYDDYKFSGANTVIRNGKAYDGKNPPFVNVGSHQAVTFSNGQAVATFPHATGDGIGASGFVYLWSVDDTAHATFNNATLQHPTLTMNQAGWYEVSLKVTDSSGNIGYGFRYVYAFDPSAPPPKFLGNPQFKTTESGWSTSVTLPASEAESLRDYSFLMAWRENWYDGVKGEPIGEKMLFCGYITQGSVKINPSFTEVSFEAVTLDEILKAIPVQAWAVQPTGEASWETFANIQLKRLIYYSLRWFSNALEVADFYLDSLGTRLASFSTEPSGLFSVAQQIAQKFYASVKFDQAGRAYIYRDAQMLGDSARAALPTIHEISYLLHLVEQIEFTKNPVNQTRQVKLCGDVYTDSLSAVGAAVPYPIASASGGKVESYSGVPVDSQVDAAVLAERMYALANMKIRELRAIFSCDWSGLLSPAWRNWFTMTIPATETGGLFSWQLQKLRVTAVTLRYFSATGVLSTEAVFQPEATTMVVAATFDECMNEMPPAQEKGGDEGGVPSEPPAASSYPPQLNKPPNLCPLKCYETSPVEYTPGSCQFATKTTGQTYIRGIYLLRDTTWQCNNATAKDTEQWLLTECTIQVNWTSTYEGWGDTPPITLNLIANENSPAHGVDNIVRTVTGTQIFPGSWSETIAGNGDYSYFFSTSTVRGTLVVTILGYDVVPPGGA